MNENLYTVHMGKAKCAVDLGDGSERGEYVNQDYILHKMGRPHRSISLMYCYYPFDKQFPGRISEVMKDANVSFQWDYPYDDYFTYKGGIGGNLNDEPFTCMRDVRRHGQDVTLTLTVDPHCTDEQLIAIAKDLRTFGRMMLRINHEATGDWFSFTKRASYKEIGDFFVHFTDIIHEYAPNVKTIICIGGIEDLNKTEMEKEEEFKATIPSADIWSVDKYMALHWGWPYDVALRGGNSHSRSKVRETYEKTKASFERYKFLNGGVAKPDLTKENVEALEKGIVNLGVHIDNLKKFGVPVVVAINHFYTDTDAEIAVVRDYCEKHGAKVAFSDVFLKGGDGGIELADAVVETIENTRSDYKPLYDEKLTIKEKLDVIAREIYRADGVNYTAKADKAIKEIESLGLDRVPVCVAKTQYSLSDDPTKLGKPEHFTISVSDVRASAGAGFVVVYTGDVMTMPGLPKVPAADNIDVDSNGKITGLF